MATVTTTETSATLIKDTCSALIPNNESTLVYSVQLPADSGYHFNSIPSYNITSTNWTVIAKDHAYNSDNQLNSITYDFYYNISDGDVAASQGERITFDEFSLSQDRTSVVYISGGSFDIKSVESPMLLSSSESTTIFSVRGTSGCTYRLTISDPLELTYDFSTNTFTRSLTDSGEYSIGAALEQRMAGGLPGMNRHSVNIPEHFPNSSTENTYTVKITPTGSTKSNASGTSTDPIEVKMIQLGTVDFSFTVAESTYGITPASSAIKSITGAKAGLSLSTFNPTEFPTLNAINNGYFSYSQVLSYSSTSTTNLAVAGGTNIALDHTTASLKLRVGDTVTGTNIAEGTVISALNPTNAYDITISESIPSYPLADATSLTFTRTVGITRQPTISDVRMTSPVSTYNGVRDVLRYTTSGSITNSKLMELEDTTASIYLSAGMLVQGNNIFGFPKIESISNGSVVLSTAQSIPEGSEILFSTANAKLHVEEISVTGAGTASPKLNVTGYVERVGIENVTAEVVLSNFLDDATYGAVVASAGTATCTLGGSIKIYPLTEPQTLSNITISEITSSGSGTTVLAGDSKSIKYLAPSTGTSDTISYKVTDGVTTSSSAANIVITLTP
jgi:hypothetical protein